MLHKYLKLKWKLTLLALYLIQDIDGKVLISLKFCFFEDINFQSVLDLEKTKLLQKNILRLKISLYLAPAALIFLVQTEAHPAVVCHFLAPVDQDVDVVRVVQRLALAPDHGKRGGHVGRPRGLGELHLVAVDRVGEQLGVDTRHPSLDVELTHKPEESNG